MLLTLNGASSRTTMWFFTKFTAVKGNLAIVMSEVLPEGLITTTSAYKSLLRRELDKHREMNSTENCSIEVQKACEMESPGVISATTTFVKLASLCSWPRVDH